MAEPGTATNTVAPSLRTRSTLTNLTCEVTNNLTNKFIVDLVTFGVTPTINFVVSLV